MKGIVKCCYRAVSFTNMFFLYTPKVGTFTCWSSLSVCATWNVDSCENLERRCEDSLSIVSSEESLVCGVSRPAGGQWRADCWGCGRKQCSDRVREIFRWCWRPEQVRMVARRSRVGVCETQPLVVFLSCSLLSLLYCRVMECKSPRGTPFLSSSCGFSTLFFCLLADIYRLVALSVLETGNSSSFRGELWTTRLAQRILGCAWCSFTHLSIVKVCCSPSSVGARGPDRCPSRIVVNWAQGVLSQLGEYIHPQLSSGKE